MDGLSKELLLLNNIILNLKRAILDKVTTMKDGTLKITLVTQELTPTEMAELFLGVNSEIMNIDLPEEVNDQKTPSQRFRNVLYRLWEAKRKDKFPTFSLYYNHTMELLCESYKEKID